MSKTLLIIGGSEADQQFLAGIAAGLGHTIATCANLTEAWTLCLERLPDGLIVDVSVPEESGAIEFIKIIKDLPGSHLMSALVLASSNNLMNEWNEAKQVGATGYAVKPYKSEDAVRCFLRM